MANEKNKLCPETAFKGLVCVLSGIYWEETKPGPLCMFSLWLYKSNFSNWTHTFMSGLVQADPTSYMIMFFFVVVYLFFQ